jgi:predicted ribosomally synthesized peptide with nif11-like leader
MDNAKAFLKYAEEHEEVAKGISTAESADEIIAMAHDAGYEVTADELRDATGELYGELSDEDLEAISGGHYDFDASGSLAGHAENEPGGAVSATFRDLGDGSFSSMVETPTTADFLMALRVFFGV